MAGKEEQIAAHDEVIITPAVPPDPGAGPGGEPTISWQVWPASFALMLTWIGQQSCYTLAAPIMGYINSDIGPQENYVWISASIQVAVAVVWPIAGSLSDTFGRRYFFLTGLILSIIGTILAGTAKSVSIVILGTTILGLGSAAQQMVLAAISEIYPNKYRGIAQGTSPSSQFLVPLVCTNVIIDHSWVGIATIVVFSTPFTATGPVVAHMIVKNLSWRWVFYISLIVNGVAFVFMTLFYHPPVPNRERPRRELLKEIDFFGCIIYIIGLTSLLVGISWAGSEFDWSSPAVLVPLLAGLAILVACGFWVYGARNPVFPPKLLMNLRGFTSVIILCFIASMPLFGLLGFLPMEIGALYTSDIERIGIYTLPLTCGTVIGGTVIAGIRWYKPTNIYLAGSAVVLTVFSGLLSTIEPGSVAPLVVYSLFYGIAVGILEIAVIVLVQFSSGPEYIGTVTGLLSSSRAAAAASALSIYATIVQTRLSGDLPGRIARAVLPLGLPESSLSVLVGSMFSGNFTGLDEISGMTPVILRASLEARKYSFAYSFRPIYWLGASLGAVATILAYMTRDISPHLNSQLNVDMHRSDSSILDNIVHHGKHEKQRCLDHQGSEPVDSLA